MTGEAERAGPQDRSAQGTCSWNSLPDSELMVGAWGDKHGAACQYSPSSSNLPSATPEVTSLCLIPLYGFLPRIYLAVF